MTTYSQKKPKGFDSDDIKDSTLPSVADVGVKAPANETCAVSEPALSARPVALVAFEDSAELDPGIFTVNLLARHRGLLGPQLFISSAVLEESDGAIYHDGKKLTYTPGSVFDALSEGESARVCIAYEMTDVRQNIFSGKLFLLVTLDQEKLTICETGPDAEVVEPSPDLIEAPETLPTCDELDVDPGKEGAGRAFYQLGSAARFLDMASGTGSVSFGEGSPKPVKTSAGIIW